jgi:dipeptidyl aminopeptidase/acylaminoacyl peptidase
MPAPRPFRPADLLREVQIQEIAMSPDGETVVYARRTIEDGEYRSRLWAVPWRGGRPERLTSGPVDGAPRFSPDGTTLLFLSNRSEATQPWLLPLRGGEPQLLCNQRGVAGAEWSNDGGRVLLHAASGVNRFAVGDPKAPLARRIDRLGWRLDGIGARDELLSAWVVSSGGGRARRVTDPEDDVQAARWTPDGTRVTFLADRTGDGFHPQAWSVPAEGGRPRLLARLAGEIEALAYSAGGRLAFVGYDHPSPYAWRNAALFVVDGRRHRQLGGELDRPISQRVFSDLIDVGCLTATLAWLDDEHVVALVTDRGETHPFRFGLDGSVERLAGGAVVCTHVVAESGRIAAVVLERGRPGEVCRVEDGRFRRLTRDGSRWLGPFRRDPERVSVAHPDGHEIDAWLLRGRGARRRRLVLQVHGGPHLAHGVVPWLELLALASAGFSILYGNPRGSVGCGEDFAGAIAGDWGSRDASDVLRLADWAATEGLADRDRTGLLGLSYGGYMTNWLLGRHPGRFRAAVSENPVTDLAAEYGSADVGWLITPSAAGIEHPWNDWARTIDRSPASQIHRNEAPLLLLQAAGDLRCPEVHSFLVFAILRSLERRVELVHYPDESHLMLTGGRPDRRVDRLERIVDWFERHL